MLNHIFNLDIGLLTLRIFVGLFFVFSGYHKLRDDGRHATLERLLTNLQLPFVWVLVWIIPAIEYFGGIGILFGAATKFWAVLLLGLMFVAIYLTGRKGVQAMKPIDIADRIDDWLYLPTGEYIPMLFLLVCAGAGRYSLDFVL